MTLSDRSIDAIADELVYDMVEILRTDPVFSHRLDEVLADAATVTVDCQFPKADEELKLLLATRLANLIF